MTGRDRLALKKGVTTDALVTTVRCLRCNLRWAPTRVLRRRPVDSAHKFTGGYTIPAGWWRCPNLCNGRGTAEYDTAGEFSTTPVATTSTTPVVTSTVTTVPDADEIMPRRKCSGEVLSFADLAAVEAGP